MVADFENFWGSKATLRALPDGSLRTGVVWDCKPHQRHLIVKWIALHVLARHAGLGAERVAMQPFYFEPLLAGAGVPSEAAARAAAEARRMRRRAERAARRGGGSDDDDDDDDDDDEDDDDEEEEDEASVAASCTDDYGMIASRLASDAFTELAKMVRRLDLPLLVRDFRCVSPVFRLTEPFPPGATQATVAAAGAAGGLQVRGTGESQAVVEVVLQFEASARWPDDVAAMQQVKLAFLIRIARLLSERGGSEDGITTRLTRQYLDVHFRGFVFRVVIFVKNEPALVQQQASQYRAAASEASGTDAAELVASAKELTALAAVMRRDLALLPQLTSWIRGFAVQFPSFAPAARLAKRWVRAYMCMCACVCLCVCVCVCVCLCVHTFVCVCENV